MSDNQIGNPPTLLAPLAEVLPLYTSLTVLELSGNQLDFEGLQQLQTYLRNCSSLVHLGLANNYITSEGASLLLEWAASCSSLARLDIAGNRIHTDGARALLMHGSFQDLNLARNQIKETWTLDDCRVSCFRPQCAECDARR